MVTEVVDGESMRLGPSVPFKHALVAENGGGDKLRRKEYIYIFYRYPLSSLLQPFERGCALVVWRFVVVGTVSASVNGN